MMLDERAMIRARSRPNSREGKQLRAAHRETRDLEMYGPSVLMHSKYINTETGRDAFEKLRQATRSLLRDGEEIELPDINEQDAYRRLHAIHERLENRPFAPETFHAIQDAREQENINKVHGRICDLVPQLRQMRLDDVACEALELPASDLIPPTSCPVGSLEEQQHRLARGVNALESWKGLNGSQRQLMRVNIYFGRFDRRISALEESNATLLKSNAALLNIVRKLSPQAALDLKPAATEET